MFWHGTLGLMIAVIAVSINYAVHDAGTGNGLQLFHHSPQVYGLLVLATLGDTIGINLITIAF